MKKLENNGRATGKIQVSISLPVELIQKIDAIADSENRNRSNFIGTVMQRLVDADNAPVVSPDPVPAKPRTSGKGLSAKRSYVKRSPAEIKVILKEAHKVGNASQVCEKYNVPMATFYRWKSLNQ